MDELPPLGSQRRFPFQISLFPFLFDHRIQSGSVLPAVQTMQILAGLMRELFPDFHSNTIVNAGFGKLLHLPLQQKQISALCEAELLENGNLLVKLLTKAQSKSGIVRNLQHACLEFSPAKEIIPPGTNQFTENYDTEIPINEIYPGLVSFGESFQNLKKPVQLNRFGAKTQVSGGKTIPGPYILGSPFPLDAAFQAACAWGKHYIHRICYPVAFEKRLILRATKAFEDYIAYICLKNQQGGILLFDIMLVDSSGKMNEQIEGLKMQEIGMGSIKKPV